jgi:hypothetical protein
LESEEFCSIPIIRLIHPQDFEGDVVSITGSEELIEVGMFSGGHGADVESLELMG